MAAENQQMASHPSRASARHRASVALRKRRAWVASRRHRKALAASQFRQLEQHPWRFPMPLLGPFPLNAPATLPSRHHLLMEAWPRFFRLQAQDPPRQDPPVPTPLHLQGERPVISTPRVLTRAIYLPKVWPQRRGLLVPLAQVLRRVAQTLSYCI